MRTQHWNGTNKYAHTTMVASASALRGRQDQSIRKLSKIHSVVRTLISAFIQRCNVIREQAEEEGSKRVKQGIKYTRTHRERERHAFYIYRSL